MRLLIASDLHGSYPALNFLYKKAKEIKPDFLVLLGDLVYHGPRNPLPEGYDTHSILKTMPEMTDLPCPVIAVRGNCDAEVDVCQMPFAMPESAWINMDGLRFFAVHGHQLPENAPFPQLQEGTVILCGHTHVPRGEKQGKYHICNPGSLSLPKKGWPKSYGIYEEKIFRVLSQDETEILSHVLQ